MNTQLWTNAAGWWVKLTIREGHGASVVLAFEDEVRMVKRYDYWQTQAARTEAVSLAEAIGMERAA